ncbi:MAG TPA: aminodeoxychorismate/anthranilate synthase component II [Alphaproteobacteria bacterium]
MILLIDNYDSFVHNLARYFGRMGLERQVVRNDAVTLDDIETLAPEAIVLSPGPRTPREAGICVSLIEKFYRQIPILGICLGHQCIAEAFGGATVPAGQPVHGRASDITHDGSDMFASLPPLFRGGRYHSLAVALPPRSPLTISARAADGTVMAIRHNAYPVCGLQFHPESVLTDHGAEMLRNFVTLARRWNARGEKAAA